jgi:hypothetical protein
MTPSHKEAQGIPVPERRMQDLLSLGADQIRRSSCSPRCRTSSSGRRLKIRLFLCEACGSFGYLTKMEAGKTLSSDSCLVAKIGTGELR